VERLRRQYHGWDDGSRPELQRVHRVIVRTRHNEQLTGRAQDLADLEALDD
jgi:hypothetical protein